MKHKVVILGAGPAGLSAGLYLSKAGYDVTIVDKKSFVGGASASYYHKDFKMDFGPHAFHIKSEEITNVVRTHYPEFLQTKYRSEKLLYNNKFFSYPLEFTELITKINPLYTLRMLFDLLYSRAKYSFVKQQDTDFENWGIKRFGRSLYEFGFGKYTERIWGMPANEISYKLAEQKLKEIDIKKLIAMLLGAEKRYKAEFWKQFIYPEDGIGVIFENIAETIKQNNGKFYLTSSIKHIYIEDNHASKISIEKDGEEICLDCDYLLSSIPINQLISYIDRNFTQSFIVKADSLKFRSLILINVILKIDKVTDVHWVYLIDSIFSCNRFTEQKNMAAKMIEEGKTVLCFELCCNENDHIWNMSDGELFKIALKDLHKITQIDERKVIDYHIVKLEDAYPVYRIGFDVELYCIFEELKKLKNIFSYGRQGLFTNNDMHDSMEMGYLLSQKLIENEKFTSEEWYVVADDYLQKRKGIK